MTALRHCCSAGCRIETLYVVKSLDAGTSKLSLVEEILGRSLLSLVAPSDDHAKTKTFRNCWIVLAGFMRKSRVVG